MFSDCGGEGIEISVDGGKNDWHRNEEEDGSLPSSPIAQVHEDLVVFGRDGGTLGR